VSAQRAQFGAVQNRLEYTLENAAIYQENLTASESRIRDVDMASEMVNFTKLQILQQAGTSDARAGEPGAAGDRQRLDGSKRQLGAVQNRLEHR
jgi:flagellin-like hook-associated protein FlgL